MASDKNCRPAWIRPLDKVAYPNVWLEFEAKESKNSDKLVKYRIQDLPEDRFDDAIKHMKEHYLVDEPLSKNCCFDEDYLADCDRLWRASLQQKTSLVCFRDGSDDIVALNMLLFSIKNDTFLQEIEALSRTKEFQVYFRIFDICYEHFSPYEKYNVDQYISSLGLSVAREYRGLALGTRMLQARRQLGIPFGYKITESMFTSDFSNVSADNAGFQLDIEFTFDELNEINPEFKFKDVPSSRVAIKTLVF